MPVRIVLADEHCVVRQAFRVLTERHGFVVVAEAANGREAVRLAVKHRPDLAVLALSMPQLNGLDAAEDILHRVHGVRLVLLTMHRDEHQIVAALRAGIHGYLLKSQPVNELIEAITEVAAGGMYLSPAVSSVVVDAYLARRRAPADPLARREREVLQLVAEGETTKEIAATLDLSVKSAESYRARIMAKLDIHDTAGLVRYAIREGLIEP